MARSARSAATYRRNGSPGSSVAAAAAPQRRKSARRSVGTPSRSAMTSTGSCAA